MSKAEERALEAYPKEKRDITGFVVDIGHPQYMRDLYIEGYTQAEKDLIENEHEKSWRLDEQLWSGFKDIEEASYQYIYDASNDWLYEIPTWHDVQDAFKAGARWKENIELTWEDINRIEIIIKDVYRDYPHGIEVKQFGMEVLKRFNKEREEK